MRAHVFFFAACALLPASFAFASNGSDDDGISSDGTSSDDDGSSSDDDGDSGATFHSKVVTALLRSPSAPDSNAKGKLEVKKESKSSESEQEIELEVENLPTGHSYFVYMEDAAGSGNFVQIKALSGSGFGFAASDDGNSSDDDDGTSSDDDGTSGDDDGDSSDGAELKAKWKVEGGFGSLPFGVASVDDLAGRGVEIRDELNVAYLYGTMPSLVANLKPTNGKVKLDAPGAPKGLLKMKSNPKKAKDELEVSVGGLKGLAGVTLEIEHPQTHTMAPVANVSLKSNGGGKLRLQTKKGDTLPFGSTSVKELSGLNFQVRNPSTSAVIFTGKLPKL